MTAEEFRKRIAEYGMSQGGACRFFGISRDRISSYATGRTRVPALIEITFALLRYFDVSPAVARHMAGLPQVHYRDVRRDLARLGRKRKFIGALIKMGHGGRRPGAGRKPGKAAKEVARSTTAQREQIHERTRAGRERAMANGVKFGRKPKLNNDQRAEALKRRVDGEPLASIAKTFHDQPAVGGATSGAKVASSSAMGEGGCRDRRLLDP